MSNRQELLELFSSVLRKMKKAWTKEIRGINPSQFFILKSLLQCGPQKAVDLAETLQLTPGAITGAADKLVTEGYAVRKGAKDRRVVYLEITEKGKQLTESMLENQKRVIARFFEGLPDEDIQQLISIFGKISENIDREDS